MNCKKCNVPILYPNRPFALVEDDSYCSQICFDFFYESKQIINAISEEEDIFANWKGEGYCSYCNSECNPASQTCGRWPRCY
jgi:hypothetical protein